MTRDEAVGFSAGLMTAANKLDAVQPVAPIPVNMQAADLIDLPAHDPMVQLSEQHIRVSNGRMYKLVLTCAAFPEQYEVRDDQDKVMGYLRLRHSYFYAAYVLPDGECEEPYAYEAEPQGDGWFLDEERGVYLTAAVQALHDRHTGGKAPVYQRREIGEGDWGDCTKEQYDHAMRDPVMDTRIKP
jgi:hypothetical protein